MFLLHCLALFYFVEFWCGKDAKRTTDVLFHFVNKETKPPSTVLSYGGHRTYSCQSYNWKAPCFANFYFLLFKQHQNRSKSSLLLPLQNICLIFKINLYFWVCISKPFPPDIFFLQHFSLSPNTLGIFSLLIFLIFPPAFDL